MFTGAWQGTAWAENAWALDAWAEVRVGVISIIEADDVVSLTGIVVQLPEGIIVITEEDDTVALLGNVPVKFVIDILDLNLTVPKADEDPLEQQRILIENLTLIQQALRNLGQ